MRGAHRSSLVLSRPAGGLADKRHPVTRQLRMERRVVPPDHGGVLNAVVFEEMIEKVTDDSSEGRLNAFVIVRSTSLTILRSDSRGWNLTRKSSP